MLANHFDKVRALENVFSDEDAIKCEVGMLRQLVEKSGGGGRSRDKRKRQQEDKGGG
jgi:hypothetical protein